MGLHKILKIVVALLGLAGVIFLVRVISVGDDAIKAGDDASIEPFAYVSYIILGLAIGFVLLFVIKNLFTNTGSLKNTLIGGGAFLLVLVIAYMISTGADASNYMYNKEQVTEGAAHMVGAGLIAFYILIFAASISMMLSGIKKMIK